MNMKFVMPALFLCAVQFNLNASVGTVSSKGYFVVAGKQAAAAEEFRKEQLEKIRKNDEKIAELKKAKANTDKAVADAYNKRIDALQKKNAELRTQLTDFKYNSESKWEEFKREFNHDMDELGKSLKDLGKDNVK
jgi:uncharacterized protein